MRGREGEEGQSRGGQLPAGAAVPEAAISPRTTVKARMMLDFIRLYKGYITKGSWRYKGGGSGRKGGRKDADEGR